MRKSILIMLCLMASLLLTIGGTLAYQTNGPIEDQRGQKAGTLPAAVRAQVAEIDQLNIQPKDQQEEEERVLDVDQHIAYRDGNALLEYSEDTPGLQLLPSFQADETSAALREKSQEWKAGFPFWVSMSGARDEIVFVENKGNVDAYIRTIFAFECPQGYEHVPAASNTQPASFIHLNVNDAPSIGSFSLLRNSDGSLFTRMIAGIRYSFGVYTYANPLKAPTAQGRSTVCPPSILQIVMDRDADNAVLQALSGDYTIRAYTQAVEADAFASVNEAFSPLKPNEIPWDQNGRTRDLFYLFTLTDSAD